MKNSRKCCFWNEILVIICSKPACAIMLLFSVKCVCLSAHLSKKILVRFSFSYVQCLHFPLFELACSLAVIDSLNRVPGKKSSFKMNSSAMILSILTTCTFSGLGLRLDEKWVGEDVPKRDGLWVEGSFHNIGEFLNNLLAFAAVFMQCMYTSKMENTVNFSQFRITLTEYVIVIQINTSFIAINLQLQSIQSLWRCFQRQIIPLESHTRQPCT